MRLLVSQHHRNKGRYLLLAAALLGAASFWLTRQAQRTSPSIHTVSGRTPGQPEPLAGAATTGGQECLSAPAGSEAPPPPKRLTGRLGLYVAVVDPVTLAPLRVVSHGAGGLFPLASSYKQAVLWALLRQKDAGTLQLSETFDVTSGTQSLGDYPFDHSDVLTLAGRMIHDSDNTATDLLHRRVGLQAVQDVADGLGLCQTRLILPTKDWWTAQAGLSPHFPGAVSFSAMRGQVRLQAAQALDADATSVRPDLLQRRLDGYFDHSYDLLTDLGTQNVSTPAEFAHLVAAEFLQSGLSPAAQEMQRRVMATGFGRSRIAAPLTYFGGKGGNGWRLLAFSGYLHTRGGEDVVYAFMQHGADQQYTMHNTSAAFRWINGAMKQVLLEVDGGQVKAGPQARTQAAPPSP